MKNLFLSLLIGCFAFSSCHSLVEDEFPDFEKAPVMNGLLQADSLIKVHISLTASLNDSTPKYVSNAVVILESDMDTPDTLIYSENGWYISNRTARQGATYTCRANIPNYPTVSAQTTVPFRSEIGTIKYNDLADRGTDGEKILSFEFSIQNDKSKKQFWYVKMANDFIYTDYNYETNEKSTVSLIDYESIYMTADQDSVLINEARPLELFSNKYMKAETYNVKFYLNSLYTSIDDGDDKSYLLLMAVDESYYKYLKQYYIYAGASEPTLGLTSQKYPLYSNIKNGLGIFTSMAVTRKDIKLSEL